MASKHFHNDPNHLVVAALRSLTKINPSVAVDEKHKIVYLKKPKSNQVSVISGGGSGHEPAFAAYVGHGMLSGAVAGSIFASPSTVQIYQCLMRRVDNTQGVMVIVMNYTGDALHFGMAVEKCRAQGIKIDMLVVGDDVGVGRAKSGRLGRRGIAGTVLVHKIACALAATGASLDAVSNVANLVSSNLVTVGASLAHVHLPGRALARDDFNADDDIELGMGIHNEEGCRRLKTGLPGLVKEMLAQLLDTTDKDRAYVDIKPGEPTVLLINNLGGVSGLEFGCITDEVCSQLKNSYSLQPVRILTGTFMSSLNGLGFSVSLLRLVDTGLESQISMLKLLDAPAQATGWSAAVQPSTWVDKVEDRQQPNEEAIGEFHRAIKALESGLVGLISAEPEITKYDTMVGDGDCGLCLKAGAEAVLAHIKKDRMSSDVAQFVSQIAYIVESSMDGTSGAIYAIFLNSLAYSLSLQETPTLSRVTAEVWSNALKGALKSLGKYTPAQPGDRTLVDALQPFVEKMVETQDVVMAVAAARKGCESTRGMEASLGRSVYVGGDDWKNCPDPGAAGLVEFLSGLISGL
ncbi:hypothetical protein V499_01737 [Pseudogymnoascus sp. VKM F-103]|nr:hypothetical protein V499_01737 [Pseudogymnoascus sp. VKM F-103]